LVSCVDISTTAGAQQVQGELRDIAQLCLCVRNHREGKGSQLDDVHGKWRLAVIDYCARERENGQSPRAQYPLPAPAAAFPAPELARVPVVIQRAHRAKPASVFQVQAPTLVTQPEQQEEAGRRARVEAFLRDPPLTPVRIHHNSFHSPF
jgi:hypothetical protein